MSDRGLHERILGLPAPWHVEDVELREDARAVIVKVGTRRRLKLACPECGEAMDGYDHRRRSWQHLDTCQYKTIHRGRSGRAMLDRRCAADRGSVGRGMIALQGVVRSPGHRLAAGDIAVGGGMSSPAHWAEVDGIMDRAVARGLARREHEVISFLGIDETSFQKRHFPVPSIAYGHLTGSPRTTKAANL